MEEVVFVATLAPAQPPGTCEGGEVGDAVPNDVSALGAELGPVLDVSVSGAPSPQTGIMYRAEMAMAADTPVEPGSQAVTVTVNLSFRLAGR